MMALIVGTFALLIALFLLRSAHNERRERMKRAYYGGEDYDAVKWCEDCGGIRRMRSDGKCGKCGSSAVSYVRHRIGFRDVDKVPPRSYDEGGRGSDVN